MDADEYQSHIESFDVEGICAYLEENQPLYQDVADRDIERLEAFTFAFESHADRLPPEAIYMIPMFISDCDGYGFWSVIADSITRSVDPTTVFETLRRIPDSLLEEVSVLLWFLDVLGNIARDHPRETVDVVIERYRNIVAEMRPTAMVLLGMYGSTVDVERIEALLEWETDAEAKEDGLEAIKKISKRGLA